MRIAPIFKTKTTAPQKTFSFNLLESVSIELSSFASAVKTTTALESEEPGCKSPVLPHISCLTLGKALHLLSPPFPYLSAVRIK